MMNANDLAATKLFAGLTPGMANAQTFWSAVARLQANGMKAALRYNVEVLDFLRRRAEKDIKLIKDLAASDAMRDAFDVYSDFMDGAFADYATETGRVAGLGSKIAGETADEVRREADSVITDMAASTVS